MMLFVPFSHFLGSNISDRIAKEKEKKLLKKNGRKHISNSTFVILIQI